MTECPAFPLCLPRGLVPRFEVNGSTVSHLKSTHPTQGVENLSPKILRPNPSDPTQTVTGCMCLDLKSGAHPAPLPRVLAEPHSASKGLATQRTRACDPAGRSAEVIGASSVQCPEPSAITKRHSTESQVPVWRLCGHHSCVSTVACAATDATWGIFPAPQPHCAFLKGGRRQGKERWGRGRGTSSEKGGEREMELSPS